MTPIDLEELAERVESGSGADRELDSAILDFLNDPLAEPTWPFVEGSYAASVTPPLTTSLDAVVRLIEEKLPGWNHGYATGWYGQGTCGGFVFPAGAGTDLLRAVISKSAPTPARVLLAAALRAMKEEGR